MNALSPAVLGHSSVWFVNPPTHKKHHPVFDLSTSMTSCHYISQNVEAVIVRFFFISMVSQETHDIIKT